MSIVDPHYVDLGELRGQDDVPLARYLGKGDRAKPGGRRGMPFFSGREREVALFRNVVNNIAQGDIGDATIAVEGPPGAGKTALLCQFIEETRRLPAIGDPPRPWLPVFMDAGSAMQPESLMRAVDEAIARQLATELLESARRSESASIANRLQTFLNAPGTENARTVAKRILDRGVAGFGFRIGAQSDPTPTTLLKLANLRQRHWSDWQIMLMLDEAQHISAGIAGADPRLLSSLHQGAVNLPMTFCAFGLPGTLNALADVGVSRASMGQVIGLGGLDEASSGRVVDRCFARYGVEGADRWKSAILERSANWPQHLACYLTGALAAISRDAGTDDNLGTPDNGSLVQAIAAGDKSRAQYYDSRMQRLARGGRGHIKCAKHIIPKLREAGGGLLEDDVADIIAASQFGFDDRQVEAFLSAAKQSGFLIPESHASVQLAIPTFAGYIMGEEPPPVDEPSEGLAPVAATFTFLRYAPM